MKNVSAKLLKVIGSVSGNVVKSGFNSHQKYAYVMEKDLLDAVRSELVKNGLLILTSVESVSRSGDITTVRTKHTIIDVDSGESVEVWSAGEGKDAGDKAGFKAITGSNKYFLFKTFLLSGNDDPEHDTTSDKPTASAPKTFNSAAAKPKTTAPKAETPSEPKKPTFGGSKPTFNAPKATAFENSEVQF